MPKKKDEAQTEHDVEIVEETAGQTNGPDPIALAAERDEWRDKTMRVAAEYENFRKRTARERETLYSEIRGDALAQLLPVYDNLLRAAAQPTDDQAYAKGVKLILQQWQDIFAKLGVTPLGEVGQPFDPNFHEAVAHTQDESRPANTIAEVFTVGFKLNDKILRHAVVRVVN